MTVSQVASAIGGRVEGDGETIVARLAAIDSAITGDLTFAADERRAGKLVNCPAGAAIVGKEPANAAIPLIRVADVQQALARLLSELAGDEDLPPVGIDPSAKVAPDAAIAANVAVGPGVVVGSKASIGPGCVLCANVSVGANVAIGGKSVLFDGVVVRSGCQIGNNVRIGPNSVVGWDGFGYYFANGAHQKIVHAGNVVIEDDVEIGACTCIDKAKFGSTRVGRGSKIDNLVQIAHNVQIGNGCIIVGQSGLAGSSKLGNFVVIGGHAGIRDNITLGDGVQCSAFAAVAQDIQAGQVVAGVPAGPAREQFRMLQAMTKLPELLKRVKELESRLATLESTKDH
jgi:UDP-3-O-[3-hydroxymyristoyl] glucosamine N-acyltransferase